MNTLYKDMYFTITTNKSMGCDTIKIILVFKEQNEDEMTICSLTNNIVPGPSWPLDDGLNQGQFYTQVFYNINYRYFAY